MLALSYDLSEHIQENSSFSQSLNSSPNLLSVFFTINPDPFKTKFDAPLGCSDSAPNIAIPPKWHHNSAHSDEFRYLFLTLLRTTICLIQSEPFSVHRIKMFNLGLSQLDIFTTFILKSPLLKISNYFPKPRILQ